MLDIPILKPRGPAPAAPPSRYDIPILLRKGLVPGSGPRVQYQLQHQRAGVFAEEGRKNAGADMAITKWVAELLHSHYRGHFWAVATDSHQGVCLITIPTLLGNWKWCIRLNELTPWMVIKAGGDILERFNIPRSAIDVAAFCEARLRRVSRASQKPPS